MIYQSDRLPLEICLGRAGESNVNVVSFNMTPVVSNYIVKSMQVLNKRPGEDFSYPVFTEYVEPVLHWTVSAVDTAKDGAGLAEIVVITEDGTKLSAITKTKILPSLYSDQQPDPPPALKPWLEETLTEISDLTDKATTAAKNAEKHAESVTGMTVESTTLVSGSEATVNWNRESGVLSFGIPEGPQGKTGPRGLKGDKGDTGPQGIQGPKGDTGDAGPQGIQGPKGDKGDTGPQGIQGPKGDTGDAGLNAPQIDDTTASPGNPWSGEKVAQEIDAAKLAVIDKVCPPFEQTGSVVQCYPVEGYPLDVVTRIEAVQEGEGDPSPDNVRLIRGWDSLELTRCGGNLFDVKKAHPSATARYTLDNGNIIVPPGVGYAGSTKLTLAQMAPALRPGMSYIVNCKRPNKATDFIYLCGDKRAWQYGTKKVLSAEDLSNAIAFYGFPIEDGPECVISNFEITFYGSSDAYKPYTGNTYTQALPETVYGGSYNWATGELVVSRGLLVLNRDTIDGYFPKVNGNQTEPALVVRSVNRISKNGNDWQCNQFAVKRSIPMADNTIYAYDAYFGEGNFAMRNSEWDSYESAVSWLDQRYTEGNPVTVEYTLKKPLVYHLTPQQILSIPGVNNVFSDAGGTTVSGRADPIHLMQTMLDRLAALEAAQTGL